PQSAPLLPTSVTTITAPFAVESQRREAAASLRPLHELMVSVKDFDTKTVSRVFTASANEGSGPAIYVAEENHLEGRDEADAAFARQQEQRQMVTRILDMTDGIAADVSLNAHPDNFALPLR